MHKSLPLLPLVVAHAKDRKKPIPMSKLSEDFGQDFMSTCQVCNIWMDSGFTVLTKCD